MVVAAGLVGVALLRSTPAADMVVEIGEAIVVADGFRADNGSPEQVAYQQGIDLLSATTVSDGRLDQPVGPEATAIWNEVVAVFPPDQLGRLTQFALIADGPSGNLGMVHRSERHHDGWILSIDPTDARSRESLRRTLVHELSHLITLSRADIAIDPDLDPATCDGVVTDVGCARRGSVIADFHEAFWQEGTGLPDDHVTPYAGTSSAEDLAETFTVLVLRLPVGDGPEVEAKLTWVAGRPELAAAVDAVRVRLSAR